MIINNINRNSYLNTKINFKSKNSQTYVSKSNLLKPKNNGDTFSTRCGNNPPPKKNLMTDYQISKTKYTPKTGYEKDFINALRDFSKITDSTSKKARIEKEKNFMNTYHKLIKHLSKKEEDSKMIGNILCSMIETFDNSQNTKVLETLNSYIFEDFIPFFNSNDTVKRIIEIYANADILENSAFKTQLEDSLKNF